MTQKTRLWIIIGVLTFAVIAIFLSLNSQDTPKTAQTGAPLAEVAIPASFSPEAERGALVFAQKCKSCHGENAAGNDGFGPPLVHIYYEPSHHGDMAFVLAMTQGVRAHHWSFGDMPPVQGITEAEALDVITYVRELQRANGIN